MSVPTARPDRSPTVPASAAEGWEILLPRGWVSLPTDPEHSTVALRRVLDRTFRGKSRDELARVRIELDRALREQIDRAREQGAQQVHTLVEPVAGVPITASLVVAEVEVSQDDELPTVLRRVMGGATGVVENDRVTVADLAGLRRVRRVPQQLPSAGSASASLWTTYVDFVLDLGRDRLLLLVFSTSTDPVAEELVMLFDSIASSLHRRPA